MPLVVRGPGVAAGSTTYKLVLNTDYLPTFTDLAGEQSPPYVDGRSLRPVLERKCNQLEERHPARSCSQLLTSLQGHPHRNHQHHHQAQVRRVCRRSKGTLQLGVRCLRTTNTYDPAAPPTSLAMRLQASKEVCAAYTCRTAEDGS